MADGLKRDRMVSTRTCRNAALCANFAATQVTAEVIDRDADNAKSLLDLAQSCTDVSTLIYTNHHDLGIRRPGEAMAGLFISALRQRHALRCDDRAF